LISSAAGSPRSTRGRRTIRSKISWGMGEQYRAPGFARRTRSESRRGLGRAWSARGGAYPVRSAPGSSWTCA
jgi:hypothetical protein